MVGPFEETNFLRSYDICQQVGGEGHWQKKTCQCLKLAYGDTLRFLWRSTICEQANLYVWLSTVAGLLSLAFKMLFKIWIYKSFGF